MIDRLRQMAIFAKAIDHGSFRGAAAELRLSPSVVSHHISQLEEHLGVALIYRSTRKLRLTTEGQRLLAAAQKMLAAVEGELAELSSVAGTPSGELRVTLPSVLAKSQITHRIAGFLKTYPRVRLSLDFSDERRKIIDDGFDVAVSMTLQARNSATSRKLFRAGRVLVAAPQYIATQPPAHTPEDLSDWSWMELAPARESQTKFYKGKSSVAVARKAYAVSSNDVQAIYSLARSGVGLAIVPDFLAASDLRSGEIVEPMPDWSLDTLDVFASWPSNAPKQGLIKLLVDALSKAPERQTPPQ